MVSAGRKAGVTGEVSAIGKAVAERLRQDGAEVLDVDTYLLKSVEAAGCKIDDGYLIEQLAAHAHDFDYLVNAAGVLRVKPVGEASVEDWRMIQTVNAESVLLIRQLIGARRKPGAAVNPSLSSAKLATSVDSAAKRGITASNLDARRKQAAPLTPAPAPTSFVFSSRTRRPIVMDSRPNSTAA